MPRSSLATGLLAVLALGCGSAGGAGDTGGSTPCNPLEGASVPLEIGEVLGVGRAMDGKLYAIEQPPGSDELRILESEGDLLFARAIVGAVTGNDGTMEFTHVTVESAALGYTLLLEVEGSEVRMARIAGQVADLPTVAEAQPYERLEVVSAEVLDELTPRAIPTANVILYFARVSNGEQLAVVGPQDLADETFEGIRVFYGSEGELRERPELALDREDDDTTHMRFDLDGELAHAIFPPFDEVTGEVPPATLELGGGQLELERLEDPSSELQGARFLCL